jgi:hypothetical protein
MSDPFENAEVLSVYTRAQALQDGVLVEVSAQAKEHGFKVPVAMTYVSWCECVQWTATDERSKPGLGQSAAGRLHDVLTMAMHAARNVDGDRAPFTVLRVPTEGEGQEAEAVELVLTIHGGDKGEPVCTIMLPWED